VTFWVGVAVAYLVIMSVGLSIGRCLAERFPRRDDGRGPERDPVPTPTGPSFAAEWEPLGSAFDRALLPGAFDEVEVTHRAA
jgi:hypothetical protein